MSEIKIGSRLVGDGHPCLISLEPGATHTGLESAKALTKAAADRGADAIKLQTRTSDKLMATRDTQIEYDTVQGTKKESVYEAMKRRELTPDEWKELKKYADGLGLLFISAPSDKETVDLLVEMDVAAIKQMTTSVGQGGNLVLTRNPNNPRTEMTGMTANHPELNQAPGGSFTSNRRTPIKWQSMV